MSARIGVSPLTGRIFSGRTNKAGNAFVGEKRDVTSDVLRAVIEKAEFHGGAFDIEGGGESWIVTVAKKGAAPAQAPQPLTLEQIDAMGQEQGDYDSRSCCWSFNGDPDCRYNLQNFVRAIERAHGIKEPT